MGETAGAKRSADVKSTPLTRTTLILAALGALPCSWRKPYRPSLHPLYSSMLYSLLIYTAVGVSAYYVLTRTIGKLLLNPLMSTYYRMMNIETLLFLLPCLVTPVSWVDVFGMRCVLSAWDEFEKEFRRVTGAPVVYKRKQLEIVLDVTALLIPGAFFTLSLITIPDMALNRRFLLALIHGNMVHWAVTAMWIELCVCLSDASVYITRDIEQRIRENGLSAEKLQDYRILWLALRAVPDAMGSLLAPMLLFSIALILITLIIYECIALIYREYYIETIMHAIAGLNYVYQIFTMCTHGHQVSEQIKLPLDEALAQVPLSSFDTPTKREIMMFYLVGNARPTTITLRGFLQVDKSLFGSMIGAVSTYLIVLVQFNVPTKEEFGIANITAFTAAPFI